MKRTMTAMLALCLAAGLVLPASALEYTIDAPDGPDYGKPTSVEVVHTADGGARKNEDVSKNAALIPPGFGTPSMDTLNAAFPESRGRCVFFCPQTGLKGKPPCPHSASIKTSTIPS